MVTQDMVLSLKFQIQARSFIVFNATGNTTFVYTIDCLVIRRVISGGTMNCVLTDRATSYFVMEIPFSGSNMAYLESMDCLVNQSAVLAEFVCHSCNYNSIL